MNLARNLRLLLGGRDGQVSALKGGPWLPGRGVNKIGLPCMWILDVSVRCADRVYGQ